MIDVCLLGTGGMMPLPNRPLTSLYIRHDGRAVLIDCGEGTQTEIRKRALRFKPIEAIFFTHFHADHISGLPGLLLTLGNESRAEPLHMYGPPGLQQVVTGLRAIVPELPYEIIFHELSSDAETRFECIGLEFCAFSADHGIPCLSYHAERKRLGKFDAKRAKENGIPVALWKRLQAGETVDGFTPADVLIAPRKGISFVYATDTRPVPAICEHGKDADLLILEGMFGDAEKQARAEDTGHMMMQEAANLARKANAAALWLTHYSPANDDPAAYAEELQAIFPHIVIPAESMSQTLRFRDEE